MNILKTTIGYLAEKLGVPVSADVPSNRPPSFVTVTRAGGSVSKTDDRASITVQAWHEDRLQVESFADAVVDAMLSMRDEIDGVHRVDVQKSYYPFQGEQTFPRYVLACEVYCQK